MENLTARMRSALKSGLDSPQGYVVADGRTKCALERRGLISGPKGRESLTLAGLKMAEEGQERAESAPEPQKDIQPRDVVTIHKGDRLYEVLEVDRLDGGLARVYPVEPVEPDLDRGPHWVGLDLLHVRQPVARVYTEEVTGRVREARETFAMPDGTLRVVRTILMDTLERIVTLAPSPPRMAAPVATLREGEAVEVDGRCFAVTQRDCGHLGLEPAPHRDRMKIRQRRWM